MEPEDKLREVDIIELVSNLCEEKIEGKVEINPEDMYDDEVAEMLFSILYPIWIDFSETKLSYHDFGEYNKKYYVKDVLKSFIYHALRNTFKPDMMMFDYSWEDYSDFVCDDSFGRHIILNKIAANTVKNWSGSDKLDNIESIKTWLKSFIEDAVQRFVLAKSRNPGKAPEITPL